MGPHAVHLNVVTTRAALVLLLLCGPARSPVYAQFELTGSWAGSGTEDLAGDGLPLDYTGYPLTEDARTRGLSYSQSQLSMIERQCQGWPTFYFMQGPFGLRIWSDTEGVNGTPVSYTIGAWENRAPFVIWMDGRPHPTAIAPHTRAGFTTGRWEGSVLVAETTHMQAGFIRKTGVPSSDQTKMTTRFYLHDDILTVLAVIEDPVHLAEPQILTHHFLRTAVPIAPVGPPCVAVFEGTTPGESVVHYAPEKNPFVDEMTVKFGVPRDAALGVPETLYPEYRKKMKPRAASK
jgi:hypothetical protein